MEIVNSQCFYKQVCSCGSSNQLRPMLYRCLIYKDFLFDFSNIHCSEELFWKLLQVPTYISRNLILLINIGTVPYLLLTNI